MADKMIDLGDGFCNIRGSFRIGGLLDVGTQCSLVELASGEFVFLDSYTLNAKIRSKVDKLTDGGKKVAAIINLHPFHTVHCARMHEDFPEAKLYGTQRHHDKLPELPWDDVLCESTDFAGLFGDELECSVPDGALLVTKNSNVHCSSVLAYHKPSRTVHVDDTLMSITLPGPLALLPKFGKISFHPTLAQALDPRAGAADDFEAWAVELGERWSDARWVAAAHNSLVELKDGEFTTAIKSALTRVKPVLAAHRLRYR